MKKAKIFTVLALLLLIQACTACHGQSSDKSVQDPTISAPAVGNSGQHIQRQLDKNLSVDAEVTPPSNIQKIDMLSVTPLRFDTLTQVLETLLISKNIIQNDNFADSGSYYQTADGKELFYDRKTLNFQTYEFRTYIYQLLYKYILPGDRMNNCDRFSQKQNLDLPFMPYQQAVDEVKMKLDSLGISVYDQVETYSLDYQTLQAQEKALKENGDLTNLRDGTITLKDGWSKEDDCYYMFFRSVFDKIPIYPWPHGSIENNTFVASAYITACYSHNGLEYLAILDSYQKKAVEQEGLKIISSEEALAAVKRKYEDVILTEPITISTIELNYVPKLISRTRDEFQLVPAWCLAMNEVKEDGKGKSHTFYNRMIIDATTGDEIL